MTTMDRKGSTRQGDAGSFVGKRFGRLVVSGVFSRAHRMHTECLCDCGLRIRVRLASLKQGVTKSCGCYQRDAVSVAGTTHGKSNTKAYSTWRKMRVRCGDEHDRSFHHYGGRGIVVCERWQTFENFYADMGDPPPGTSIDRIDNNGNYEPGNCRWATVIQQNRNTRRNTNITAFGETRCLSDWPSDNRCSVKKSTIRFRLAHGWSQQEAISLPPLQNRRQS